jgi:hypothetical protein
MITGATSKKAASRNTDGGYRIRQVKKGANRGKVPGRFIVMRKRGGDSGSGGTGDGGYGIIR